MIDTETIGLFDTKGAQGIISLGLVLIRQGEIQDSNEFLSRPQQQ
ncbi:hypothetical protein OAE16_01580 [Porticoccaceae bacterium]|nr:hypothetical protein [Porticoccaceae bacterium]